MVFVPPKDRVLETSTSNSQTVFTVTGAVDTSYNAFSASMSVGDTTIGGVVEPGVAFRSGILTYSAANQVTVSTTKENKGTFSASGTKEVFMGQPASLQVMMENTDPGAVGAILPLYHNSLTPAVNDRPVLYQFYGNDSAGNKTLYGELSVEIFQTTNLDEVACLTGQVMLHGTLTDSRLGTETFLLGYNNPAQTNFEYVFRGPFGYQTYMYLESFDGGATGPTLTLWHASPTPAVSDDTRIYFDGYDTVAGVKTNYQTYCFITGMHIVSTVSGAEENLFKVSNCQAGDEFYLYNGLVVGAPTGANKGVGTGNFTAAFDDGVALITCYPLEQYLTGTIDLELLDTLTPNTVIKAEPKRIRPADKKRDRPEIVTEAKPEQLVERKHEPARKFIARLGTEHDPMTLAGQRKHVADKKHLTSYQNPQNFSEETRPSIGSLLQSGIEMDELNFLYITQLADELAALVSRLDALENRPANRRP